MTGGSRGRCTAPADRRTTEYPGCNLGRRRRLGRDGMRQRREFQGNDFEEAYAGQRVDLQQLRREARVLEERLREINKRIDLRPQQSSE